MINKNVKILKRKEMIGMIRTEQMVAGLLLKFNELDSNDLGLLMYELSKNNEVDISSVDMDYLGDYLEVNEGIVTLNKKLSMDTFINKYGVKLKRKFQIMQGRVVKNYLDHVSAEEFVLRKIKYLKDIAIDKTSEYLLPEQIKVLPKLFSYGYLTTLWNDDVNKENYQVIELTQKAKLLLFAIDNDIEIKRFKKDLIGLNYDYTLLNNYLMSQDLNDDLDKILNAEKFYNYCLDFSLYPYMPKLKSRRLYSN